MAETEGIGIQVFCNGQVVAAGTWNPGESPLLADNNHHEDIERIFAFLNEEYDPILLATAQKNLPDAQEVDTIGGRYKVVFEIGMHF